MKIKILSAALGLALTTLVIGAKAQTSIPEGIASYTTELMGQPADVKAYFNPDSSATVITFGAGNVKILQTAKHDYVAVVLDIPVAQLKKAGIETPAEIEQAKADYPTFTFTPTTTAPKQISGFTCKRVVAKDNKTNKEYDVWVTNDITTPSTGMPLYYANAGGYPVQYTAFQKGQDGSMQETTITLTSIVAGKAPKGTYSIDSDFEKVSMSDLHP
jgi:hypothetical protein